MEIPSDATGSYILQTLINCTGSDDCSLQSSSQIKLVGPVRDIIIRPARHAYRPGDIGKLQLIMHFNDIMVKKCLTVKYNDEKY